jgi:hypothetical protein
MKILTKARFKTRIIDSATGTVVKESPWGENMITDQGLNGLATSSAVPSVNAHPAGIFSVCVVGGGTNPNAVASGAVTFTQVTNQLTASAPFFTFPMVGQLFKYGAGTGGAECYITGVTSDQVVTVDTSATVSTPTVGTVWNVAQGTLQTPLLVSTGYQTNSGNCGTTLAGNQATHQRYFVFAPQPAPYTVNEIGYGGNNLVTAGGYIAGRFVLGSSDVVAPTQFYLVIMQFIVTYSPANPSPVSSVGTNINTAGALALESIGANACQEVTSSGGTTIAGGLDSAADLYFATATYSQNGAPQLTGSGGVNWTGINLDIGSGTWAFASARGAMTLGYNTSITTTGQTLYGIGIGPAAGQVQLDVLFATPQTAPTGLFEPQTVWRAVYNRVLSN